MRIVWTMTITVFCLGIGTCSLSAADLSESEPPSPAIGQAAGSSLSVGDVGNTPIFASPTPSITFVLIDDQKPLYKDRYDFKATPIPASPAAELASTSLPTPLPTPVPASPAQVSASAASSGAENSPSAAAAESSRLPVSGQAMYYNPGVMQEVYAYRLDMGQIQPCSACVGYAALLRAGDINRRIWLQWADGAVEGPFLVIDVAASHHVRLLLSRDWVVDVDYETALRRGMVGPVPVTLLAAPSAAQ